MRKSRFNEEQIIGVLKEPLVRPTSANREAVQRLALDPAGGEAALSPHRA